MNPSLEHPRASDAEPTDEKKPAERARGTGKWFLFAAVVILLTGAIGYQLYETRRLSREVARLTAQTNAMESESDVQTGAAPPAPFARPNPDLDHWNPRAELRRMQQEMNQLFGASFSRFHMSPRFGPSFESQPFSPNIDVEENENAYLIRLDVPGLSKANLNVEVENGVLRVRGETSRETEDSGSSGQIVRKERFEGRFERDIPLPEEVDSAKMTSVYENGVLTLTLPKKVESNDSHTKETPKS